MSCFHGYEKMCSSSNELGIIPKSVMKEKWVVLEKIHGANFSFIIDQQNILPARVESENFFGLNSTNLLERLQDPLRRAFQITTREYPQATVVTIFGELFGGIYDHPDVPEVPGVVPVQVEIQYCPDLNFRAYDITVEGPELPRDYLDYDVVMKILEEAEGVDFVRPYLIGTMEEALHFDIDRETLIPKSLGLPPLPPRQQQAGGKNGKERSNLIEGVVVKPVKNAWVDSPKGRKRVVVKIKNQRYLETQRDLYKQEKREKDKMSNQGNGNGNEQEVELIKEEMKNLLTRNRLINTISKVGSLTIPNGNGSGSGSSSSSNSSGTKGKGKQGKGASGDPPKSNREKVEEMLVKEVIQETNDIVGDVARRCTGAAMSNVEQWLKGEVVTLVNVYLQAQAANGGAGGSGSGQTKKKR